MENCQIYKGKRFASRKASTEEIEQIGLLQKKNLILGSRGGSSRKYVCSDQKNCDVFIWLIRQKPTPNEKKNYKRETGSKPDEWYVSSLQLEHTPTCSSTAKPRQRQVNQLVLLNQVIQKGGWTTCDDVYSRMSPQEQQLQSKQRWKRMLYRAKHQADAQFDQQLKTSFRKLPAFLHEFRRANTGSLACYDCQSSTQYFSRAIIMPKVFKDVMIHNSNLLGIQIYPSKHPNYDGFEICLSSRDANNQDVLMAVAVVPEATADNFMWFVTKLQDFGIQFSAAVIFVDQRQLGLRDTLEALGLDYAFWLSTIIQELEEKYPLKFCKHHHQTVELIQSAETYENYLQALELLQLVCGHGVSDFIRSLPPIRWALHANQLKRRLCDWLYVRTYHPLPPTQPILPDQFCMEARNTPFGFLLRSLNTMVSDLTRNRTLANEWIQSKRMLTSEAQILVDQQLLESKNYHVQEASNQREYETWHTAQLPIRRRVVNIVEKQCSCPLIFQKGIPCSHLFAVLIYLGKSDEANEVVQPYYFVRNFAAAYSSATVAIPLEEEITEREAMLSSTSLVLEPPPKRNKRSDEEVLARTGQV